MPGALACSSFTALSASRGVCSPARTSLALSGSRPITSLAAQSFRGVTFNRSSRLWRPVMVAQKASQTETEVLWLSTCCNFIGLTMYVVQS